VIAGGFDVLICFDVGGDHVGAAHRSAARVFDPAAQCG